MTNALPTTPMPGLPRLDYSLRKGALSHVLGRGADVKKEAPQTSVGSVVAHDPVRASGPKKGLPVFQGWLTIAADPLAAQLAHRLFELKTFTSQVAMHLTEEWRTGLFRQLDFLMSPENWEEVDPVPSLESYRTALRLVILLGHVKRPGLGFDGSGHIMLAWTKGNDRLTIECQPGDVVRWIISHVVDGERETAAGQTKVTRIPEVLRAFGPEKWLENP